MKAITPVQTQFLIEAAQEQIVGMKAYRPLNPKAMAFHHSAALVRCIFGANRGGKSRTSLADGVAFCEGTHPLQKMGLRPMPPIFGRVIATDFPHGIQKAIIPTLRILATPSKLLGGDFDSALAVKNMVLRWSNGSFLELMSYEQDVSKFAAVSRHFVHYDEEPPEEIRDENVARLIEYRGWEVLAMTPEYGCTWVYDTFKLPWDMGNPDKRSLACWTMSIYENPYIDPVYIKQKEAEITDLDTRRIKFGGEFVHRTGLIFGTEHFNARPPWLYNEFPILAHWPVWVGIDTHNRKKNAVVFIAVSPSGELWVYDCIFKACTMGQLAKAIKAGLKGRTPVGIFIDPSAKGLDAEYGTSYYDDIRNHGINAQEALRDPKMRIMRMWEKFAWNPALVSDHRIVYEPTWPAQATGGPGIHICKQTCQPLIWQLQHYVWKDFGNRRAAARQDTPDTPLKKDDDLIDGLGYVIIENPRYIEAQSGHDPLDDHFVNRDEIYSTPYEPRVGVRYTRPGGWLAA